MNTPVTLGNIDGTIEQGFVIAACNHLYLVDLFAIFPKGAQVFVSIKAHGAICNGRYKPTGVELGCKYVDIVVIEIDKGGKVKTITSGTAFAARQYFEFYFIGLFEGNFGQ